MAPAPAEGEGELAQKSRVAEAEASLAEVKDPRAVPSVWKVFGLGTPDEQEIAIDILGQIEGERAARALAGLAIFGKSDLVRKAAVETLTRRNPDDVLMLWVGLLEKPVKYEVRQVAGPGSPGYLTVEGTIFNVRRNYSPPSMSQTQDLFVNGLNVPRYRLPMQFNSSPVGPPPGSRLVGFNQQHGSLYIWDYHWAPPSPPKKTPDPSPKYQSFEKSQLQAQIDRDFELSETAKMAEAAQAQLEQDVNTIEVGNAMIRERNARLAEALRRVSGKDLGDDREAWLKWYMERRGYKYIAPADRPKPTLDMQVPLPYVPQAGPPIIEAGGGGGSGGGYCMIWEHFKIDGPKTKGEGWVTGQCFASGTAILTPAGSRPIETLRPGDLVLTGDAADRPARPGAILAVHRSCADRTLRLSIGGEAIVATQGHPLWKVGSGWTRPATSGRVTRSPSSEAGRSSIRSNPWEGRRSGTWKWPAGRPTTSAARAWSPTTSPPSPRSSKADRSRPVDGRPASSRFPRSIRSVTMVRRGNADPRVPWPGRKTRFIAHLSSR